MLAILFLLILAGCATENGAESATDGDAGADDDVSADGDGETPDGDESEREPSGDGDAGDGETDGDLDGDFDDDIERVTLDLVPGCNPFATSDECVLPFPSSFFERPDADSPTGVRGDYPPDALPNRNGDSHFDIASANAADGCSPAAPLLVHFGVDVAPEHLTPIENLSDSLAQENPIAVFDLDTGKRLAFMSEMDMNRSERWPGRYVLIVRPMEPMEMGHRHVVALRSSLRDVDGGAFESPAAFAALRDGVYTTNAEIETAREKFDGIFAFLNERGYARGELLLAWDFMVASEDFVLGSVLSMREETLRVAGGPTLAYTIEEVADNYNANVLKLVKGAFEVPTYLNEDDVFEYDDAHHPIRRTTNQSFPFTMIIPPAALNGEPIPLIVFGHGIFGEGREYLTNGWAGEAVVQPLSAEFGAAVIATDWIGLSHDDLQLIIDEIVPDLNRLGLVTDRLQQSLVNNLTMTELALGPLQEDPQVKIGDHALLDPERVYYYGVSLGGIQGSSFVSLSNRIRRGVLTVPGSVWSNMLPRSIVWTNIQLFFEIEYPDPLIRQLGIGFMQSRFDHSDPINLTQLMFRRPLPDKPEGRAVILQEAIGDCQVPNMTTEMLARGIGLKQMTPGAYEVFGLEAIESPTPDSVLTQYLLPDHLDEEGNWPPAGNFPPQDDNGVHSDMVFLQNALEQVSTFLLEGQVVQYCDGSCDPN